MRVPRCRDLMTAVFVTCALATSVQAQAREAARTPAAEIGMEPAVLVRTSQGGSSNTFLALPGGPYQYFSMIYASLFVSPQFAFEPAATYQHVSGHYSSSWLGVLTLRATGYQGAQANSAFVFAETGFAGGSGGSDTLHDLGVGAGYRWLVAEQHVAVRLEGFYRHWSRSPSESDIGAGLRVGVVIPRAR